MVILLHFSAELAELDLQIQAAQRIEDDLKLQYNDVLGECLHFTSNGRL